MDTIFSEKILLLINLIGTCGGFASFFILDPHIWIISMVVMVLCGCNVYNGWKYYKEQNLTIMISA